MAKGLTPKESASIEAMSTLGVAHKASSFYSEKIIVAKIEYCCVIRRK